MVSSVLVMEMVAMLLATCSHATASGSSAAVLLAGDYTSTNAGRLHRLRGGFEAVMPLKPANLGTPNQWSGMNFGKIPRSFVQVFQAVSSLVLLKTVDTCEIPKGT